MTFNKLFAAVLGLGLCSVGAAQAAVDTIDYNDNGAGYFFVEPGQNPTQFGSTWYRDQNGDWGWQHNAIGVPFTTAKLNIGAYDVDAAPCGFANPADCEHDKIFGWDAATLTWLLLGELGGSNNAFQFTEFDLTTLHGGDLLDDVAAGLQVKIDIDANATGFWLVSLSKSVITTDDDDPGDPNPGKVPLPAGAWLMVAGIGALGAMRRRKKA